LVCVAGEAIQGELQRELPVNGFNRSQLTIILLSASSAVIVMCAERENHETEGAKEQEGVAGSNELLQ